MKRSGKNPHEFIVLVIRETLPSFEIGMAFNDFRIIFFILLITYKGLQLKICTNL